MSEREADRYAEAIRWALGEGGHFPLRRESDGPYWWRKILRTMANLSASSEARK